MRTKFTENPRIKFAQQTLLLVLVTRRFVFLCIAKRVTVNGVNSRLLTTNRNTELNSRDYFKKIIAPNGKLWYSIGIILVLLHKQEIEVIYREI